MNERWPRRLRRPPVIYSYPRQLTSSLIGKLIEPISGIERICTRHRLRVSERLGLLRSNMRPRAPLDNRLPRRLSKALTRSQYAIFLAHFLLPIVRNVVVRSNSLPFAGGVSFSIHRWTLDSASFAQAVVHYLSLKVPALTETHIPARMAEAVAYPASMVKTCITVT